MSNLADMTGAPAKYEGFELSPLSFDDWGYFERWAKDETMALAARAIQSGGFGPDAARTTMDVALSKANQMYFLHPECQALLKTQEGQILIVYLSMRHTDSEITMDILREKFKDDITLPTRLNDKVTEMTEGPVMRKMDELSEKKSGDEVDEALRESEITQKAIEASSQTP